MQRTTLFAVLVAGCIAAHAQLPRSPSPEAATLYIISPTQGDVVGSPLTVRFGLSGMGVAPAGIEMEATGHHHLLIDLDELPAMGLPIPNDDRHRHFGGGQTEVTLELPPGEHSLQLLLGDHLHVPHEPPMMSEKITITVQ